MSHHCSSCLLVAVADWRGAADDRTVRWRSQEKKVLETRWSVNDIPSGNKVLVKFSVTLSKWLRVGLQRMFMTGGCSRTHFLFMKLCGSLVSHGALSPLRPHPRWWWRRLLCLINEHQERSATTSTSSIAALPDHNTSRLTWSIIYSDIVIHSNI